MLKPLTTLAALAIVASGLVGAVATAIAGAPQITHFTLVQRAGGRGDSRSPRAGRHPHDLVQGRLRRRDAGQIGPRAFPRTPDVQGHRQESGRRFSQVVATIGGQENAFTSSDYTGYFQRVPRDQLKAMMEFEADRMTGLDAHRRGGAARARRRAGRAQHARRQQSRCAARRADGRPRSISTIPTAGR